MNIRWKTLIVRITLWLAIELWLNFLGLDEVADYSEFISDKHLTLLSLLSGLKTEQLVRV